MQLIEQFKYLSNDIIQLIVNYTDIVVFRHGVYIDRLNKKDERYKLLERIERPMYVGENKIIIRMLKYYQYNSYGYIIEYNLQNNIKDANIKFIVRERDGFDSYYYVKTRINFIFQ